MGGSSGKLIELAQILSNTGRQDYEHARLYLGDGKCVEARPGGAAVVDWIADDGGLWSTGIIFLTDAQRKAIVDAGWACVGTQYSVMDYFALAAYKFKIGLLVPGLKKYVATSKHMICSQLVDHCYQVAGVQLFNDERWEGYVSPGDLADLLHKEG